ncbi:MAG: hypothetical protein EHM28_05760 [Spirochaetaceae bacterium]|nr:MAG: hypothetical protein EHM28_05760 [Spirochaetaceae bacterium]
MKNGLQSAKLPGRMEVLRRRPLVIADGAHTPESIKTVIKTVDAICSRPRILVFASVSGKKFREMADLLSPGFDHVIISTPGLFKKSDPEEVFKYFSSIHSSVDFCKKPADALKRAYRQSRSFAHGRLPIIVTGSFYFVSEIRKLF